MVSMRLQTGQPNAFKNSLLLIHGGQEAYKSVLCSKKQMILLIPSDCQIRFITD